MADPKPLRAVIYTRISLDRSGDGDALERQEAACRAMCTMRDWRVVDVVSDTMSAYSGERPGWSRVLAMIETGEVDVVVVWKIDRLTRTVAGLVDAVRLARATGVSVATTDGMLDLSTAVGKAVTTILATVAEMETELKQERQLAANRQRRERGEPWKSGWKTFGYELASGDVIEPEAELIRSGADAFLSGEPLSRIADDWTRSGVTPRSGGAWSPTSVRSVLANPRLAGHQTYKGKIVGEGAWTPILEPETHALIAGRLAEPGRRTGGSKAGPRPEHLLSAFATCSVCGELVQSRGSYRCRRSHVTVDRDQADALVVSGFAMAAATMLPGLLLTLRQAEGNLGEHLALIDAERAKQAELAESYAAGRVSLAVLESATSQIDRRIVDLEANMPVGGVVDVRRLNGGAVLGFAHASLEDQRSMLARVARVRLFPRGRGRKNVPIAEQVAMQANVHGRWVDLLDKRYGA